MNIAKYHTADDYLATVIPRLENDGFNIANDVVYKERLFKLVAKRGKLQPEYLTFTQTFFIFVEFSSLNNISLKEFSRKCYKYSRRSKTIPIISIPFETVLCIPVALVPQVDYDLSEHVRNTKPRWHFSDYEMPVVYDLAKGKLHYAEKTHGYGLIYYFLLRVNIGNILAE